MMIHLPHGMMLKALVGKTELGGEYGEDVVIKNMTRLNDPNERFPFYTKIVRRTILQRRKFCPSNEHRAD